MGFIANKVVTGNISEEIEGCIFTEDEVTKEGVVKKVVEEVKE